MKKTLLSVAFLIGVASTLWGQETAAFTHPSTDFEKAIALYNRQLYAPAQNLFRKVLSNTPLPLSMGELHPTDRDVRTQSEYYIATIAVRLGQEGADALVNDFIVNHPESPLSSEAYMEMAHLYFQQGDFEQALAWYEAIDELTVAARDEERFNFEKGYSLFATGKQAESKPYLEAAQTSKEYGASAKYYLGYIAYDSEDYAKAEAYFKEVPEEEKVGQNVAYFQANMYFKQSLYEEAIAEGKRQLGITKNAEEISELNKIIGESYFNLKQYKEALPYLMNYKGKKGKYSNTDYYYIGYAYYKEGNYTAAIGQFNKIVGGNDSVAQNAYYHLAECYLKTGQKQQALNAFRNASQMDFEPKIKQDAMLNYARLGYEIGNPYESVPEVLQMYASVYPTSHTEEIQGLLVDSYISSGNYAAALNLLEKSTSAKDKEIYKKVAFYRGLELFNERQYTNALGYLQKAQGGNEATAVRAAYWAGEAAYALQDYKGAANFFTQYLNSLTAPKTEEYAKGYYGLAYAYFNDKNYAGAIANFEKYLKQSPKNKEWKHDAQLRLADCYFVTGKYWPAMEGYNKLVEEKAQDVDYAAYQKAISYGFVDRQQSKIEDLEKFIKNYKGSSLRPNALYELASAYISAGNTEKGIALYQQLKNEYKGNILVPKAMLREGLVYYNKGENQKALQLFKQIAKDYPNSTEANQAVASAKLIYVDTGKVAEYAGWAKSLGYVEVSDIELEGASYEAAERQYMQNNNKEAIAAFEKYLKDYPRGMRRASAEFQLAQLYFEAGQKGKALPLFESVAKSSANEHAEQSLTRVCQILLDAGSYLKAKPYLEELEKTATVAQNKVYAQSNLMRVCYNEKLYDNAIAYANKVLEEKSIDTRIKNDAYIVLARAYSATGKDADARKYYAEVQKTASGSLMAEALYYEALYKHQDKDYKGSNEVVQRIAKEYGGHKEFAAKSLIVMAKNFAGLKDSYQASYILESVVKNFKEYPAVVAEAKKELVAVKAEAAKSNSSVK
ncbi:tetratricopeptide repeat protein [Capnocytophaga haemolytica]